MNYESIIDEIYEAAIVPSGWMKILDRMGEVAGGTGTLMFADSQRTTQSLCSASIEDLVQRWVAEGWVERDDRARRLIPRTDPRFLTDLDEFSLEELADTPIYRDFFWKLGLGWCAGTTIRSPTSDSVVFSIQREFRKGPVEPEALKILDGLRPHLARAAILSASVGLQRAWSSVDALQAVGIPAAVLTQTGKVIAANSLLAGLGPGIAIGAGDRLYFENTSIQALCAESLKPDVKGAGDARTRSFPLQGNGSNPPAVAHMVPLRGLGRDIFTGASALLYVTVLSRRASFPDALLQALFDLTPAEARVAGLIGNGHTVSDVAAQLAVQANTVRSQLKSIFSKTGVGRQAELVGLITIQGALAGSAASDAADA
jgi:DNA-binding CsgD family transcriptional regulator